MKILKLGVKVSEKRAEELRRILLDLGILERELKPCQLDRFVVFPITEPDERLERILEEFNAQIVECSFEPRSTKPRSLKDALKDKIPKDLIQYIPSSYDLIGDLILIEIPDELRGYSRLIGEELMKLHPRVKSVLMRGETVGEYRIRRIEVVAGSNDTETIHREHGCMLKLDLRKVFFNPRFSGERLRVARSVAPGENVLDMFAGVGPFSIIIARIQPECRVTAIELNPEAYRYLVENIRLNKVADRVTPIHGDARKVLEDVRERYDRVIMDLPHSSLGFIETGLRVCKENGIIHFYGASDSVEKLKREVLDKAREHGYGVEIVFAREVMEVAPRRHIFVLDLRKIS